MCGVIGYASESPNPQHAQWVRALCWESRIRGLHAFGWAAWRNNLLAWGRHQTLEEWLDEVVSVMQTAPTAFIAHTRYSTSGDWHDSRNNQPLVTHSLALACNGTIDMGTKAEIEQRWDTALHTENDSELVLQALAEGQHPLVCVEAAGGSFAGCWLDGPRLMASRNEKRPLWEWYPDEHTALVASTEDIFRRAIPESKPLMLEQFQLHCMNPWIV